MPKVHPCLDLTVRCCPSEQEKDEELTEDAHEDDDEDAERLSVILGRYGGADPAAMKHVSFGPNDSKVSERLFHKWSLLERVPAVLRMSALVHHLVSQLFHLFLLRSVLLVKWAVIYYQRPMHGYKGGSMGHHPDGSSQLVSSHRACFRLTQDGSDSQLEFQLVGLKRLEGSCFTLNIPSGHAYVAPAAVLQRDAMTPVSHAVPEVTANTFTIVIDLLVTEPLQEGQVQK